MKRTTALELLSKYRPTKEEKEYKNRMIGFIDGYKHAFNSLLTIGHVTVSAWLLNKDRTHVLFMQHPQSHEWRPLGGHCDGNNDPLDVMLKKAKAQSGITNIKPITKNIFDIEIQRIPRYDAGPAHDHYDIRFLLAVTSDEFVKRNYESYGLRWVSKDLHILPNHNPSIVRMHKKWLIWPKRLKL